MERLEDYRIDVLGVTRADEFARRLQSREPDARQALEEFLEWTSVDDEFLLIALVALAPELDLLASRLSGGYPSKEIGTSCAPRRGGLRSSEDVHRTISRGTGL
jgi:hypothetical protein